MLPRLVYCELSFSYPYRRRFTAGTSRMRLASANPLEDQVLLLSIKVVLPSLPACVMRVLLLASLVEQKTNAATFSCSDGAIC